MQGAEHWEPRRSREALGGPWCVPGVRLEGPDAARSRSTPLITGRGAWLSFWGASVQGTISKKGKEFYIRLIFNTIQ